MIRPPLIVAALLCISLAACEGTTGQGPTESADVVAGAADADAVTASTIFRQVCVNTAPSFAEAKAELAKLPFAQRAPTGTYFHKSINMSFKLQQTQTMRICSMVIGGSDLNRSSEIILAASGGNKVAVDVRNVGTLNGQTYLSVFARSPK